MNTRTHNAQDTVKEFRQAAERLWGCAAYVTKTVPWGRILKGTGKLAINILRYSMGIAIYGLVIWPYRLLVAPTCAVAAGAAATQPEDDDDTDWFGDENGGVDNSVFPRHIDNRTGDYTFETADSLKRPRHF